LKITKVIGLFFTAILLSFNYLCDSQVVPQMGDSIKVLLRKEYSFSINVHTQGLGIGYRFGHHITGYKKLMYEGEFVEMKHPKEYKSINLINENSKTFFYGKMNNLYILRLGAGMQKVINSKPYWGGVEIRTFYYGGLSLGLTKPVYLYIWNPKSGSLEGTISTERYDPDNPKHNIDYIYGRAPFTDGLGEIGFHPGIYGKFGFNFEFGQEDTKIRCLEAGINIDAYPKSIPIMAYNNNTYGFLTVYLSYSFGKRKN
jgi:hypothetical protein